MHGWPTNQTVEQDSGARSHKLRGMETRSVKVRLLRNHDISSRVGAFSDTIGCSSENFANKMLPQSGSVLNAYIASQANPGMSSRLSSWSSLQDAQVQLKSVYTCHIAQIQIKDQMYKLRVFREGYSRGKIEGPLLKHLRTLDQLRLLLSTRMLLQISAKT